VPVIYVLIQAVVAVAILWGIRWMNSPETAVRGNRLASAGMLAAIVLVLWHNELFSASAMPLLMMAMAAGALVGALLAIRVTMLQIPQMVALFNGLGGGASMLTAFIVVSGSAGYLLLVDRVTGGLALGIGGMTLSGSLVAAAKLHRVLPQQPIRLPGSRRLVPVLAVAFLLVVLSGLGFAVAGNTGWALLAVVLALAFGALVALPVGGADMPITISLLNSLSGLAASICGFVVDELLLVAVGAIVGAAGLILTRVMCAAMNRSLWQVLAGSTTAPPEPAEAPPAEEAGENAPPGEGRPSTADPVAVLREAKSVIIIPGYGMALGEAEGQVRDLFELLEAQGKDVKFAIHPVAGRMPGHMTVLLAEVDIPYDQMLQLQDINPEFPQTDVALIVGACDVVNPAAMSAKGTPIYGMPILQAHEAKHAIVCNLDLKPGYSGIENPLYQRDNTLLLTGEAAASLEILIEGLRQ
jgi:H+-translocating NAD(P) transhydrogenase subunit beta